MSLDHARQHFAHLDALFAIGLVRAREPIRYSENTA
jgi:hypothetical protein